MGLPGNTALRKQTVFLGNELKELTSKNDFLHKQIDQLNSKIFTQEKTIKDSATERESLKEKISLYELKLSKKKTKLKLEKKENQDLIDKLGSYVDKDTITKNLIRNKNDDFEKYKISNREKEKDYKEKIKKLEEQIASLLEKLNSLNQEITRLSDLLEIYNITSKTSNNRIEPESPSQMRNLKSRLSSLIEKDKTIIKDNISSSTSKKKITKIPSTTFEPSTPKIINTDNIEMEEQIKLNEMQHKSKKNMELKSSDEKDQNEDKKKNSNKNIEENMKIEKISKINEEEEDKLSEKSNQIVRKNPPNLLVKKKNSMKPINVGKDKHEYLKQFVDNYFNDKHIEKTKLMSLFDKFSRKLIRNPNSENILTMIDNILDRKDETNKPQKLTLIKQQELLMKKNQEENSRTNLKPVTIIKEIISAPKNDDPIYEEYLKWREVNKLESMIEIIKKKAKFLEQMKENPSTNMKNMSKTTQGFSNFINSNTNDTKPDENKHIFEADKPRLMTSDEIFRKKKNEFTERKLKKIEKSHDEMSDFYGGEYPENFDFTQEEKDLEKLEDYNFSKKKYFYKYPFKGIGYKYGNEKSNKTEDITEKFFENLYLKLVRQHERCGSNCGHLKRFYQRIGFVNRYLQKEEVIMNKNVIDKIPYLNDLSEINGDL